MGVSKVIINGTTKVDLTNDTVASDNLLTGYTAHGADGNAVSGSAIAGADCPTFTVTCDSNWSTILSVTCDKTFSEINAYINAGVLTALVNLTDGVETGIFDARMVSAGGGAPTTYLMTMNNQAYADLVINSSSVVSFTQPSNYAETLNITENGTYRPTPLHIVDTVNVDVPTGTARTSSDLTASGATVTVPAGLYASQATKTIASGSAATPATSITANPTISVSSSGLITATTSATKSVTPTVSAGYVSNGTAGTITVSGSNTSQLATKSSTDLTVSGATVTAPAGYYSSSASKSVASGTAGTPTATKGTVSNHSVSVTPSVTNTTGYITGSTINGTAVTVSASELVSGTLSITTNGTGIDVTNYAAVDVNAASTHTCSITSSNSTGNCYIKYNNTTYYTQGASFTFSTGDTARLYAVGQRAGGHITIDGTQVAFDQSYSTSYDYTLPDHDIEVELTYSTAGYTEVVFPTLSISTNGKSDVTDYCYADVNVPTGTARTSSDLTASGATVTVPAGLYSENATKTIASGSATTPATTVTANPSISVSSGGLITATASTTKSVTPTVSAGYVSSGTAGTITVSGSNTSQLSTEAGKTVTPTESVQTAVAAGKYTTGDIKVGAISSTYVGSGISSRSSSDLTVSGATVTVPSGYYSTQATKSVASGTAGTPTATKGTVSNHSVTVTPSVTNTTGYITGSTKTGTAVTVSASELVSGTKTITSNGTGVDVKNYAAVNVNVTPTHTCTIISNTSASNCRVLCNGNQYSFNGGKSFTFNAGYEIEIEAGDSNNQSGRVFVDGVKVADGDLDSVRYSYTAPDHDIEISATIRDEIEGRVDVAFPTVSINTNGKHDVSDYYYADVDMPTGTPRSPEDITIVGGVATIPAGVYSSSTTLNASQLVSGTKTISSNATGINVANYQYVDVTVPEPALIVTRTPNAAGGTTVSIDTMPLKVIEPLTVTLNGTYTPASGHVYSPVVVNVPGGAAPDEKPIQFIDYDGTVLYEYTESEVNALSVLPANPTHPGLTSQGWNWTLEEIQSYIEEMPGMPITIGQMYVTSSGDTEIDIELDSDALNPYLAISLDGSVSVDWGDGSAADVMTGSASSGLTKQGHVYSSAGSYTIIITVTSGSFSFAGNVPITPSVNNVLLINNDDCDYKFAYAVNAVRIGNNCGIGNHAFTGCFALEYVTIPYGVIINSGSNWFEKCNSLKGVVIPSNVTTIPSSAFNSCTNIERVSLPYGINSIGTSAFYLCANMRRIPIPYGLSVICSSTFYGCPGQKNLIIPSGVASINTNAFMKALRVENIVLPSGLQALSASVFQDCPNLKSITIPSGINTLPTSVFGSCTALSNVSFLGNIQNIGQSAFAYCYNLKDIVIPNGVSFIGSSAFFMCSGIQSLTIPSNTSQISNGAFNGCAGLQSVTLPSNLSSIASGVFQSCFALRKIDIPSGISIFGSNAFAYCYMIQSISVPSGVVSVGPSAFYSCRNLISITLPSGLTSIGTGAFAGCKLLQSITIPSGVTKIFANTFDYCSLLQSMTIPSGVTMISSYAFRGCINISEYHVLPTTPPTLSGSNVFSSIASDCVIYVPSSVLNTYKTATYWSYFSSKMQGE